jgi:hypothetical protein
MPRELSDPENIGNLTLANSQAGSTTWQLNDQQVLVSLQDHKTPADPSLPYRASS